MVPVEGKPPLFTVFVIILDEWIRCCPEIFPILEPCLPAPFKIAAANAASAAIRVDQSLRGEEITILTVRRRENKDHTTEYQSLLRDLGKPSSADREIYDI